MANPSAVFQLFRGDTWKMAVVYTAGGQPYDLHGATFGADLYIRGAAQPFASLGVADGSATIIDLSGGSVVFVLDDVRSAQVPADPPCATVPTTYPTRLVPWVADSLGARTTVAICTIDVLDARFANPSDIVSSQTAPAALAGSQGPPGPAVSVNGHSGLVQTLTASDVGTYGRSQVDALLANLQSEIDALTARVAALSSTPAPYFNAVLSPLTLS